MTAFFLCLALPAYAQDEASIDADVKSEESITLSFHGYPCTNDCSGHKAGYAWAEENGIADPETCGGNSQSFIEGCRAWAEEKQDENVWQNQIEDSGTMAFE